MIVIPNQMPEGLEELLTEIVHRIVKLEKKLGVRK